MSRHRSPGVGVRVGVAGDWDWSVLVIEGRGELPVGMAGRLVGISRAGSPGVGTSRPGSSGVWVCQCEPSGEPPG